jgi:hypothetical protein
MFHPLIAPSNAFFAGSSVLKREVCFMFQAAYAKKMSMRLLFLCSITMLVTFMLSTQAVSAASITVTRAQAVGATTHATASSCGSWQVVPSPNSNNAQNALNSIAILSAHDAWAVGGTYSSRRYKTGHTLTEHWNGSTWAIVPSPNPGNATLSSVAAVSSTNVWAVGSYLNLKTRNSETLVEHWNGTRWSVITSPNIGPDSSLFGIAVVTARDIWAVGDSNGLYDTLVEHWNGTRWSIVQSPNASDTNILSAVTAVSASDLWAVGVTAGTSTGDKDQALIEHWDGTSWSVVQSPPAGLYGNLLYSVSAVSANDIWAVGYAQASSGRTLTEHWNGSQWSVVKSPNVTSNTNSLESVVAISSHNVWAVGYSLDSTTLTEQWNGTQWNVVHSPNGGSNYSQLRGVAAFSANDIWTVGFDQLNQGQTLTEFYC